MTRFEDLKVLTINTLSLSVSFTHVENTLKILLLVFSIIYTVQRIYKEFEERKNK